MSMGKKYEGWLVYREEDMKRNERFISLLKEAGENVDLFLKVKMLEELQWKIDRFHSPFHDESPQFIINRSVSPWFSELAEFYQIPVFNRAFVSRIANDKRLAHAFFRQKNIPSLETIVVSKKELASGNTPLPFPFIVKDPLGRGGKGVQKIADEHELEQLLPLFEEELIIQPLAGKIGYDLRVYIVGGTIVAAILRESVQKDREFRANISVGGKSSLYTLNDEEKYLVNKMCEGIPLDFVGLDFLFDSEGKLLFNEMEDAVGCRSLYMNSDINIAEVFMEHVKKSLQKHFGTEK